MRTQRLLLVSVIAAVLCVTLFSSCGEVGEAADMVVPLPVVHGHALPPCAEDARRIAVTSTHVITPTKSWPIEDLGEPGGWVKFTDSLQQPPLVNACGGRAIVLLNVMQDAEIVVIQRLTRAVLDAGMVPAIEVILPEPDGRTSPGRLPLLLHLDAHGRVRAESLSDGVRSTSRQRLVAVESGTTVPTFLGALGWAMSADAGCFAVPDILASQTFATQVVRDYTLIGRVEPAFWREPHIADKRAFVPFALLLAVPEQDQPALIHRSMPGALCWQGFGLNEILKTAP